MKIKINEFLQKLGPGILMASAAIGTSHLVQSTRAGASFGYQLLIVVLLINFIKYPFVEYGMRYTIATKENILEGYNRLNKKFFLSFLFLNVLLTIAGIAVVSFICGAIANNILSEAIGVKITTLIITISCILILAIGHYNFLDRLMKFFMLFLVIATIIAFITTLFTDPIITNIIAPTTNISPWNLVHLGFIIALMGWMPGPIELSVWQSLWIEAKARNGKHYPSIKDAKFDFNFGYILVILMAFLFLSLGANVMNHSGKEFSGNTTIFVSQLISIYTNTIGEWIRPIISIAAFMAMFSTTLTVIDAYPRTLAVGFKIAYPKINLSHRKLMFICMFIPSIFAMITVFFTNSFKSLVDFVTISAFITAPIFAFANYRLILSKFTPKEFRPNYKMKIFSMFGIIFLTIFSLVYITYKIIL